jgi:membrane protease YdiL (CAAX protease family)
MLDNPEIFNHLNEPEVISSLKFMQIFQHIGAAIVPALLFAYILGEKPGEYLAFNKSALPVSYLLATGVLLCATPIVNWMIMVNGAMELPGFLGGMEDWMKEMEDVSAVVIEQFLEMDTAGALLLNLFMIGILPAVGEELMFRGVIQRLFSSWTKSVHWGIWITAILFSAMHMQFYGFLPRMMLGVLFGYLFVWSGSLLLPIFCHLIYNGSGVMFAYLWGVEEFSEQEGSIGSASDDSLITIASGLTVAWLLYIIYRKEKEAQEPIEV